MASMTMSNRTPPPADYIAQGVVDSMVPAVRWVKKESLIGIALE
jgi:hypothetical protein